MKTYEDVDVDNIAAIGFCFGGVNTAERSNYKKKGGYSKLKTRYDDIHRLNQRARKKRGRARVLTAGFSAAPRSFSRCGGRFQGSWATDR